MNNSSVSVRIYDSLIAVLFEEFFTDEMYEKWKNCRTNFKVLEQNDHRNERKKNYQNYFVY